MVGPNKHMTKSVLQDKRRRWEQNKDKLRRKWTDEIRKAEEEKKAEKKGKKLPAYEKSESS